MTCERVEELLSPLIDNELDARSQTLVNEHLQNCAACAETLRDLKVMVQASAEMEPIAPPDRLFYEIRRAARNLQPEPKSRLPRIGWVLVPAVATVALMLVVFYPRTKSPLPETRPTAPSVAESPAIPAPAPAAVAESPVTAPARTARSARRTVTRTPSREVVPVSAPVAAGAGFSSASRVSSSGSPAVMTASVVPAGDVIASLRDIQQALEEIEAALHRNPGNPQVVRAYQTTYRKGVELKDRYLVGTR